MYATSRCSIFEGIKMSIPKTTTLTPILIIVFCLYGLMGSSKSKPDEYDCDGEKYKIYADSLKILLLGNHPLKVITLVDSVLADHGNMICPDIIRIKDAKGNAYELLYNFELSVEIYNEILATSKANGFISQQVAIILSLARVYETIDRPEICKRYLDEAKEIIDKHQLNKLLSRYCVRYASYLRIFKDKASAVEYAQKAVDLGHRYGAIRSVADGNLLLGIVTEDYEQAIDYFRLSSDMFMELGDYNGAMFQQLNIASLYTEKGEYNKALEVADFVNQYDQKIAVSPRVHYNFQQYLAQIRADAYEGIGQKDSVISSLKNLTKYSQLFGELVNQEKINLLISDNTVQQEKEKVIWAKKLNTFLSFAIISLLGVLIMLSRYYLLNRRKKKKIEEQTSTITNQYGELEKLYNYQTTLLSEVHHRIKNNLQLIISLLTLQRAKLVNADNEVPLSDKALDILTYRISSISLIHEQLYNLKEFDKINVDLYVKDLIKNFKTLSYRKNLTIDYNVDGISLNLETITPLGLIWSELISNSLKYNDKSGHLKVYFGLTLSDKIYTMHYYDDGVGYPDGQFLSNKTGMGYTIIKSLSNQLFAKSEAYNSNGAHFRMEFEEKVISPL